MPNGKGQYQLKREGREGGLSVEGGDRRVSDKRGVETEAEREDQAMNVGRISRSKMKKQKTVGLVKWVYSETKQRERNFLSGA